MKKLTAMGVVLSLFVAIGIPAALAAPSSNGSKVVYVYDDYELSGFGEFMTENCGFAIEVQMSGWVQHKLLKPTKDGPLRVLDNYHLDYTFATADKSFELSDIGVHRFTVESWPEDVVSGKWEVGHSFIGHIVFDGSGVIDWRAGRATSDSNWPSNVCKALG